MRRVFNDGEPGFASDGINRVQVALRRHGLHQKVNFDTLCNRGLDCLRLYLARWQAHLDGVQAENENGRKLKDRGSISMDESEVQLRNLCGQKDIGPLEADYAADHIHMGPSASPTVSVDAKIT